MGNDLELTTLVSCIPLKTCKSRCDSSRICKEHQRIKTEIEKMMDQAVRERLETPEMLDFLKAVKIEAEHQRDRWKKTDPEKSHADWYWLIGWLGGKAVMDPHEAGDERSEKDRRLHRIITVAAAAYNWHEWTKKGL